mmetsp:Transcript_9401/g.13947  ORF Transcript_9401/g.13947 Transcript_9401/m.13947 type:complete len:239 (-) Transcript_9401:209-925(-)|eukprot:CAMPEP_0196801406 /NCGR_PEP_ID=MMETSP1362-20130617/1149_1 /TAXON_ID=163516 /ORGANISM="Leptocylindrus danicus, Strain CCMP1856" /LENGTH=238 /DNA_ID=CAMNT_0042172339 /DNA_START=294 /DNA_END=1010 /DNA_ORIENTATION=-
MGQALSICTGNTEEERKINGFKNVGVDLDHDLAGDPHHTTGNSDIHDPYNSYNHDEDYLDAHHDDVDGYGGHHFVKDADNYNEIRRQMEEQARLDALIVGASRDMILVTKGQLLSPIYDPSYAGAFLQELRQTRVLATVPVVAKDSLCYANAVKSDGNSSTSSPRRIPNSITRPTNAMETLTKGRWENIVLGKRGAGPGGCGEGINPDVYLDDRAEAFLSSVLPYAIFKGAKPIVENL